MTWQDKETWKNKILHACSGVPPDKVKLLSGYLDEQFVQDYSQMESTQQVWTYVSTHILEPELPMATHQAMMSAVYSSWPKDQLGPPPVWYPSEQTITSHNITQFLATFKGDAEFQAKRDHNSATDWDQLHALSVRNPGMVVDHVIHNTLDVPMHQQPIEIVSQSSNPDSIHWLPGAHLNVGWAALHAPRGGPHADSQPAVIWAEDGHPTVQVSMTRLELRALAVHVAACLRTVLKPGDPVAVILPLTPLTVAAYFGCVICGCPVVSIADSFSAAEIQSRLKIASAKMIITQDVVARAGKALSLYSRVISGGGNTPPVIVIPGTADLTPYLVAPWTGRPCTSNIVTNGHIKNDVPTPALSAASQKHVEGMTLRDCDCMWSSFMGSVSPYQSLRNAKLSAYATPDCLHVATPAEATNILFSSGTTGDPKAIVWDHISPLRCALDGWAHQDIHPGDRVAWPTSLGWMMGPWLLYASLMNGACVALYGGAPTGRDFGNFLSAAGVNVLGLVPSIVKAWRSTDCMKGLSLPCLRVISSTGEASSPDDYHWLYSLTKYRVPVIEYCGGTELAGGYITGTTLQPACPSTFTTPAICTQLVLLSSPASSPLPSSSESIESNSPEDNIRTRRSTAWTTQQQRSVVTLQVEGAQYAAVPHYPSSQFIQDAVISEGGGRTDTAVEVVGEVALLPPVFGCSQRLLNKDHFKVYYAGMPTWPPTGLPLRRHGDELVRLPGGYYSARGRVDDTMNLGGIKVSSVELERAVSERVPSISEVAAVGIPRPGGGPELLVLFVVLKPGFDAEQPEALKSLQSQCQEAIRTALNPLFKVDRVFILQSLPRNASNKLMRRTLRDGLMQQQATRSKL